MYKYETHLHTAPVSFCGRASIEESLIFYKKLGYDGVFVTNHFLDGNINLKDDTGLSWEEKINFFFSDYEKGVEVGKELGIKVFAGVETCYRGADFLVYGLDKNWYLQHPEIMEMPRSKELAFMMECGALVIQAHPFREAPYIDHFHLFPRQVHGVEVLNCGINDKANHMAKLYAEHYGLLEFAGSDNHIGPRQKRLAGVCFAEPVSTVEEFIEKVKNKEAKTFILMNEE